VSFLPVHNIADSLITIIPLLLDLRRGDSEEALRQELVLELSGNRGLSLPHHLLAAGLSLFGELAHILPVPLALLLLRIDTAGLKLGG